jgi:RES domain-containing protein
MHSRNCLGATMRKRHGGIRWNEEMGIPTVSLGGSPLVSVLSLRQGTQTQGEEMQTCEHLKAPKSETRMPRIKARRDRCAQGTRYSVH